MSLERFDPRIRGWFTRRFGPPTEIQRLAWEPISRGENVLLSAPTGSGKTLTAFLWALQQLATGAWEDGTTRILYVSPLKALNSDIERNLIEPLAGIAAAFAADGKDLPAIRVATRSGDTSPGDRQKILRRRPEILITTPESLNLLLNSRAGAALFAGLKTVILDEIHAVAASKRGTHLITAVDRLVLVAGEFQRIALSATVRPLERIAKWVGGYRIERAADDRPRYVRRPVTVVESRQQKRYDVEVRLPEALAGAPGERLEGDALWNAIADDLREKIRAARSTLVFTNSRRLAEKLTRMINDRAARELAWSHHGSLARELRSAIEHRLKAGELPALVATSSLELGIDIGALDQVLLVQAPRSLASAAQRIGRAGHAVGAVSRARLYPTHARDFVECAVAARAVLDGAIEPVEPVRAPLDLLAQWIVGMVALERWRTDDLFDVLRASEPYHDLTRRQFDLVVEMLAGRFADARIAELRPRIAFDRLDGTVAARPGTARLLAQSGGTIPDRGYFQLRIEESNARLGELDEEFVWERVLGDTFLLGTQSWRIRRITANEVLVAPARSGVTLAPFWRADGRDRGHVFSEAIGEFLEEIEGKLDRPEVEIELRESYPLDTLCARELVRLLREVRTVFGGLLPHRHRLVFEETAERGSTSPDGRRQHVLYTFWGGTLNRPLAMALAAAWEEAEGSTIETLADDDAVLLILPAGADPRELLASVTSARLEALLRSRLEGSGFFGAQFRQNAQRALLLPRAGAGRRTPLWVSRENAKKLLEAVARFDDFPVTLETWRSSLHDEFDLPNLRRHLEELETGEIAVERVRSERASPFASGLLWWRNNSLMYEDDVPGARRATSLRGDLLREIALGEERPKIPRALAEEFAAKVQRLLPGYAPQTSSELLEWVKERLAIPEAEWRALCEVIDRETAGASSAMVTELEEAEKILPVGAPAVGQVATVARENLGRLGLQPPGGPAVEGLALESLLEEWLRFYPPVPVDFVVEFWGRAPGEVDAAIAALAQAERVVVGDLVESGSPVRQVVTIANLETLLRWRRAAARAAFEPLPAGDLPLFLASWQGLTERATGGAGLQEVLERSFGLSLPVRAWESDYFPARLEPYFPAWLDNLFESSELRWFGTGRERIAFSFRPDLDLFLDPSGVGSPAAGDAESDAGKIRGILLSEPRGAEIDALVDASGFSNARVNRALWDLAFRGQAFCETFRPLRDAIGSDFTFPEPSREEASFGRQGRRSAFRRWQGQRTPNGRWRAAELEVTLTPDSAGGDAIVLAERDRERARLLLDRYGVVFRELLANELPQLGWGRLLRALRGLELSGEIVAGRFFDGPLGLQFALPSALRQLSEVLPRSASWWCSAIDPASPCGLEIAGLHGNYPRRLATTRLAFTGAELQAVFSRSGREIRFQIPPGHPELPRLLEPLRIALTRSVAPESGIDVETINDLPAAESPYFEAFAAFERVRDGGRLRLRRSYASRPIDSR
ncbi:MAG: DEAD/DEAH box helicase [Thermoanaerobaculia bacterium]